MKILSTLRLVGLAVTLAAPSFALEPLNLSSAKAAVVAYAESGEYWRDVEVIAGYANDWVSARVSRQREGERLALVLDIDETALSNLAHMREMDFGYVPDMWDAWVAHHYAPAIEPVREVYRQARRLGVAVFFISGRREKDRSGTESNLRASGYDGYEQLLLKPDECKDATLVFKTATREEITNAGWTIIANIGDQQSDLDGGAAERTFKLANPFYLIK